jgi:futalosine hydrolase
LGPYDDAVRIKTGAGELVALAGGVGPPAAAAATATAICLEGPFDLVFCLGIGGGFREAAPVGSIVLADRIVAADLGADSPTGFLSLDLLGLGTSSYTAPADLVAAGRSRLPEAVVGPVVTVATCTGTEDRAASLRARHAAVAEGMEGFGVATTAGRHGIPVLEVRTVANLVGRRDRGTWRIDEALAALAGASARLVAEPLWLP